uniref:Terpene synthase n=1 Tax=Laurencia subopposita TaxID=3071698 RepID=A0AA96V912_9FLOR|nr:TS-4 [Laurencia subopposita]
MSITGNLAKDNYVEFDDIDVGSYKLKWSSFVTVGEQYINEHEDGAFADSLAWLQSIKAIKTPKYLNTIKTCAFERLMSRTYPFADHEGLRAAIDLNIMTNLLDDYSDVVEATDQVSMQFVTKDERNVISVLRGERWTGDDSSIACIMQSLMDQCSRFNQGWIDLMRQEYVHYLQANALERMNRRKGKKLTWSMFENTRYYASCVLCFLYMSAAMVCTGDPADVLSTPHILIMTRLVVNHVSWFNDIIGVNKEKKEAVNNNIVFVMESKKGQTWEGAVQDSVKRVNEECETFLELEAELHESGLLEDNEDALNYIEVLKYWIRGSMDWHFESGRYRVNTEK